MKKNRKEKFWIYYNSFGFGEGFRVEEFGRHDNAPEYAFREARPNNIFQIVTAGVCHLTVFTGNTQKEYTLKAGDGFLIKSGVEHRYVSDKEEPCTRIWMAFAGVETNEMFRALDADEGISVFYGIDAQKAERLSNELKKNMSSDVVAKFNVLSVVYKFFGIIAKNADLNKDKALAVYDSKNPKELVNTVMHYIDGHIKEKISVESLANLFGYERSYFYKLFKRYNGISVQEYVINRRINLARRLCVDTDMPFLKIANELGYDSYVSFYKTFVRIVHCSPENYRKMYKKSDDGANLTDDDK